MYFRLFSPKPLQHKEMENAFVTIQVFVSSAPSNPSGLKGRTRSEPGF